MKNQFLKKATGAAKSPVRIEKRHGLGGKGLDALLSSNAGASRPVAPVAPVVKPAPAAAPGGPVELKIADIERSPYQPRRDFREEELKELAESIEKTGLVQPPVVRKNSAGRYELIAGERRMRAAQLLGWEKIPVVLKEVDELTAASMTTTENLQREDLNPIEEALSYKTLQDKFNLTQAEVAERVGKGRATVANSVRLLELPDEVRTLVQQKLLSSGHAKVLLSLESEKDRVLMARDCVSGSWPVRVLEKRVARLHAPVEIRQKATPDLTDGYVRNIADRLKKHLGLAVRLTSSASLANGRRTKGVLEVDFYDNDDLDRLLSMIGVTVE